MGKLIVELPEDLHQQLKKRAILRRRTIKEVVTDLVEGYLAREGEAKAPKETGLCGKWEDKRSAKEILADIKRHRRWFEKGRGMGA